MSDTDEMRQAEQRKESRKEDGIKREEGEKEEEHGTRIPPSFNIWVWVSIGREQGAMQQALVS